MVREKHGGSAQNEDVAGNTGIWKVDAIDVDMKYIFQPANSLLHLNTDISDFLEPGNKSRTIVIAPKGYGKTLLLKAKAKSVRKENLFRHIIPNNDSLVDQPAGAPHFVDDDGKDDVRHKVDYWLTLWLISFGVAIGKETEQLDHLTSRQRHSGERRLSQPLYNLLKDPKPPSPSDIFGKLTGLNIGEFQKIRAECLDHIVPMLRTTNLPVAVFVDCLDQYYESILREETANSINRIAGKQHKSYWYLSQLGMALAAWDINRNNPHIKVYVSIRKEVLQKAISSMHFGQQLRGKSLIVQYSKRDLERIIDKNIRLERPERLQRPDLRESSPVEAFFGDVKDLTHPVTGDAEPIIDFWLRHTLGRPRDIASIGRVLSMIDPSERTGSRVREKIREEARTLAEAYIAEMQPHLDHFDYRLICSLIDRNALDADDIELISKMYDRQYCAAQSLEPVECNVFGSLFKVGLLGYVGYDGERGESRQIFRSPGDEQLDDGAPLPKADTYLIHPALSEIIFALRANYFAGLNKFNIVGANRVWRNERQISYILTGDVHQSTRITAEGGQLAFERYLDGLLKQHAQGLEHYQRESGDRIKLLHKHPMILLRVANNINADLKSTGYDTVFRFAGDAGFLSVQLTGDSQTVIGDPVWRSARLEPHVKPGEIYVTEAFHNKAQPELGHETVRMVQCGTGDMVTHSHYMLDMTEGGFNFAKEHEDKRYTKIFRVEIS